MRSGILVIFCLASVLTSCRENNTQRSAPPVSTQSVSSSDQTVPKGVPAEIPSLATTIEGTIKITGGDCYKGESAICAIEQEIFAKTNALRAAQGLGPLRYSGNIGYIARQWSQSQSQTGRISHSGFPAQRTADYQAEFSSQGKKASLASENVAMTFGGSASGSVSDAFMKMWTNSSGHRRNMLGNFQSIGIGVYQKGSYWYATQIFGKEN